MTSPDLEALKTLVAAHDKCCGYFQYQNHVAGDGDYAALGRAARNAMPSIERLLAGQQEPVAYHYFKQLGGHTAGSAYRSERSQWHLDEGWTETPLFAALPVQEAGREEPVDPKDVPTLAEMRELFASVDFAPAEPASLGAEAAAREIRDLMDVTEQDLGEYLPTCLEIEVIIRKHSQHQPIKAGGEA